MRPKTLAEVARLALTGEAFDRCLANFLDEFYAAASAAALAEAPPLLAPLCGELGQVQDAYLAAGRRARPAIQSRPAGLDLGRGTQIAPPMVCLSLGGAARGAAVGKSGRIPGEEPVRERNRQRQELQYLKPRATNVCSHFGAVARQCR